MQSGIEPLRRIRRCHLMSQHVAEFVVERGAILNSLEVPVGLHPMGPAASQPSELSTGVAVTADNRFSVISYERVDGVITLRHSCLSKIFLRENVDGEL